MSMSIDSTVIISLITGAGAAVTALISGIYTLLKKSKTRKVTIKGKHGVKIEIPANVSIWDGGYAKSFIDEIYIRINFINTMLAYFQNDAELKQKFPIDTIVLKNLFKTITFAHNYSEMDMIKNKQIPSYPL